MAQQVLIIVQWMQVVILTVHVAGPRPAVHFAALNLLHIDLLNK
jgi:hypothetical protein